MVIELHKIYETKDRTISIMKVDGKDFCFVLEDGFNEVKVAGETRIPEGVYLLEKRTVGNFYKTYKRKFGHEFSIQIKDVPGFDQILIHIGNTKEDTRGCPLVGSDVSFANNPGTLFVGRSTETYKKLYQIIDAAWKKNDRVFIDIKR